MKKLLGWAVAAALAYYGFQFYQTHLAFDHPLAGKWKSDKAKSMKAFYQVGVTERQEAALLRTLGKMEVTIKKNLWVSTFEGETERESFEIVAEDDGCYSLQFARSKELQEVCVHGDELHLPPGDFKGAREVMTRQR